MGRKGEGLKLIKKPAAEQLIEFTQVELSTAQNMAGLFTYSKAIQAIIIAWFCGEEKYYRILGYYTEQEFMEKFAGKSYRQGIKYKEVGKSFLKINPIELSENQTDDEKLQLTATFTQPLTLTKKEDLQKLTEFFDRIGIEKFYELTQYKLDYQELVDGGVVVLQSGEKLSLLDVINTSTRELLSKIDALDGELTRHKKDMTALRTRADAEIEFARSETKHWEGVEALYGEKMVTMKDKRKKLDMGRDAIREGIVHLKNADIKEEDGQGMIKDMSNLIKELDEELDNLRKQYQFITLALEE